MPLGDCSPIQFIETNRCRTAHPQMNITQHTKGTPTAAVDCAVVFLRDGQRPPKAIDAATDGLISDLIEKKEWNGRPGESLILHRPHGLKAPRLMLVGGAKKWDPRTAFESAAHAARAAVRCGKHISLEIENTALIRPIVEGFIYGNGNSDEHKTAGQRPSIESLTVCVTARSTKTARDIDRARISAEATNQARRVINLPPNSLGPVELADLATDLGTKAGMDVEVFDEHRLRELGFGAHLAVGQGSLRPPRLVRLSWSPNRADAQRHLFLVGKGITFDSGGLSLKTASQMETMKYDMAGAATMLAAMIAIAQLRLPMRVTALLALAENMPSGTAMRPGDIVRALNGKTIEILNTDAEGRLVLADALAHAVNLGATHIIDAATLTGAVSVALGDVNAGLLTNSVPFANGLVAAGTQAGERYWRLPMDDDYLAPMRGEFSDLRNSSANRKAGTITAAKFLEQFVGGVPWIHLDIAGVGWAEKNRADRCSGATGHSVRTLIRFVEALSGRS